MQATPKCQKRKHHRSRAAICLAIAGALETVAALHRELAATEEDARPVTDLYLRVTSRLPLSSRRIGRLVASGKLDAHRPAGTKYWLATPAAIDAFVAREASNDVELSAPEDDIETAMARRLGLVGGVR